jgi:hypothetical protein
LVSEKMQSHTTPRHTQEHHTRPTAGLLHPFPALLTSLYMHICTPISIFYPSHVPSDSSPLCTPASAATRRTWSKNSNTSDLRALSESGLSSWLDKLSSKLSAPDLFLSAFPAASISAQSSVTPSCAQFQAGAPSALLQSLCTWYERVLWPWTPATSAPQDAPCLPCLMQASLLDLNI